MDDDREKVEGATVLGWLILTGACGLPGIMIWTVILSFSNIATGRPEEDFSRAMLEHSIIPMLHALPAAAIVAAIVVMAARSGWRIGAVPVFVLAAIAGVLVAVAWYGGVDVHAAFGAGGGLLGAAVMTILRMKVLRNV